MSKFEFNMDLSARETQSIYEGRARYILVESVSGLKLQLPAVNFRCHVTEHGIKGRFSVETDANNKILALRKL
jgi:hypothetical protein